MTKPLSPSQSFAGLLSATAPARHGAVSLGDEGGVRLAKGRVHEALGEAASMFAVIATSQMTGPIFWIGLPREVGTLAPTGLQGFLDPARITMIVCMSRAEILWASEQALQACPGACVIAELACGPDLRESRRLQIAAEESGAIGVMLIHGRAQTSAAETRWLCTPTNEDEWDWTCTKNKRGCGGAWRVRWMGVNSVPSIIHMATATAA